MNALGLLVMQPSASFCGVEPAKKHATKGGSHPACPRPSCLLLLHHRQPFDCTQLVHMVFWVPKNSLQQVVRAAAHTVHDDGTHESGGFVGAGVGRLVGRRVGLLVGAGVASLHPLCFAQPMHSCSAEPKNSLQHVARAAVHTLHVDGTHDNDAVLDVCV